jgi:hypothetical protein
LHFIELSSSAVHDYRAKEHVMRHLSLLLAALILSAPLSSDAQGYHVIKQTLLGGEGNWTT